MHRSRKNLGLIAPLTLAKHIFQKPEWHFFQSGEVVVTEPL